MAVKITIQVHTSTKIIAIMRSTAAKRESKEVDHRKGERERESVCVCVCVRGVNGAKNKQ